MRADDRLIQIYDKQTEPYTFTTMVRHGDIVIAFAMNSKGRIFYSVLALDSETASDFDANAWSETPIELRFPVELSEAGYGVAGVTPMPTVKLGTSVEGEPDQLEEDEIDPFLSSTARLTANLPFQLYSDGVYVYLFRQSVSTSDFGVVWQLTGGGCSGDSTRSDLVRDAGGARVPVVNSYLLCDRFVLVDGKLKTPLEVRFRRSRNKTMPGGRKDTLGSTDIDGKAFHEPTMSLSFIRNLDSGRFAALLVPTASARIQNWQIFAANSLTGRIDSFSIERDADGLFNTKGSQFFTSPDPAYTSAVYERSPGLCPFTGLPLVPVVEDDGYPGTALRFDGVDDAVTIGDRPLLRLAQQDYTLEAWVTPGPGGGPIFSKTARSGVGEYTFYIDGSGLLCLAHVGSAAPVMSREALPLGVPVHVAATFKSSGEVALYVDGRAVVNDGRLSPASGSTIVASIGALAGSMLLASASTSVGQTASPPPPFFNGTIDEVRVWNRVRTAADFQGDAHHRLIGNEPGLIAYYRCDEGAGPTLFDQTDNLINGTLTGPQWVSSQAQLGPHPGVHRDSFRLVGRRLASSLSAMLFYQQEESATPGKPMKQQARVLLTCATASTTVPSDPWYTAALDFGVSREGRLTDVQDELSLNLLSSGIVSGDTLTQWAALEQQLQTALIALTDAQSAYDKVLIDANKLSALISNRANLLLRKKALEAQIAQELPRFEASSYRIGFGLSLGNLVATPGADQIAPFVGVTHQLNPSAVNARFRFIPAGNGWYFLLHAASGVPIVGVLTTAADGSRPLSMLSMLNLSDFVPGPTPPDPITLPAEQQLRYWRIRQDSAGARYLDCAFQGWSMVAVGSNNGVCARDIKPLLDGTPHPLTPFSAFTLSDAQLVSGADVARAALTVQIVALDAQITQLQPVLTVLASCLTTLRLKQAAVASLRAQLGVLPSDSGVLPMPCLGIDRTGLSLFGALLGFAYTSHTPALLGSGTDCVAMYFRGQNGQFFSAYYDTNAARIAIAVPVGDKSIQLVGHMTGIWTTSGGDAPRISVNDGSNPAVCRVTITVLNQSEIFNDVPRAAKRLVKILAGDAERGVRLGRLASLSGRQVMLQQGSRQALTAGAIVFINGWRANLAADIAAGDTQLLLASDPPSGFSPPPSIDVLYADYDYALASCSRPGVMMDHGSRLLRVVRCDASDPVPNGSWAAVGPVLCSGWRSEAPGRAYALSPTVAPLTLPTASLGQVELQSDVSMEAWLNPGLMSTNQTRSRIINGNTPGSRYALGLLGVMRGCSLDGVDDFIELGSQVLAKSDFTIELWLRRMRTGMNDFVVVHGNKPAAANQTLTIGFRSDNTFTFAFFANDLNTTTSYTDQDWHHWACVYVNATRERRIYRDGVLVANDISTADYSGGNVLGLGLLQTNVSYFAKVQVDELRVFNRARSVAEINATLATRLAGSEFGLTGYWTYANGVAVDATKQAIPATVIMHGGPVACQSPLYIPWVSVGDLCLQGTASVPTTNWSHLAATYHQSYAIYGSGTAYAQTQHAVELNNDGDLTIELGLTLDCLGRDHGILGKGESKGSSTKAAQYCLRVMSSGALEFSFCDSNGTFCRFESSTKLSAGRFTQISVVRHLGSDVSESYQQLPLITPNGDGTSSITWVKVNQSFGVESWADITFYIDGVKAGTSRHTSGVAAGNDEPLELGRTHTASGDNYLLGYLSEVRLWNTARENPDPGAPLQPNDGGLVARWCFQEATGHVAEDSAGTHRLRLRGMQWRKNPNLSASRFLLYCNGVAQETSTLAIPGYGTPQFTLGSVCGGSGSTEPFTGSLEEVRIWKSERRPEQLLDNLYTRLHGERGDLLAYYTFDGGSTLDSSPCLLDNGLRGCHLPLAAGSVSRPLMVLSTAPISVDSAIIRSALAGIRTNFQESIDCAPAAAEYADLQCERDGTLSGVLKRCYSYVQNGSWRLLTGFKLGNLITEWVGQIQFNPHLLGYIEGAPPVPSENLTEGPVSAPDGSYEGISAVEFKEADEVVCTVTGSSDKKKEFKFQLELGLGMETEMNLISAPVGVGTSEEMLKVNAEVKSRTELGYTDSQVQSTEVEQGTTTERSMRVGLTGFWEPTPTTQALRRFLPNNTGFAVVQSETADVFALRIADRGTLVAYRTMPNRDIPPDWNLIPFPINPLYTKQGTLDGRIGMDENSGSMIMDPSYPNARDYGEYSYFKPREAYALKKRIDTQTATLRSFYQSLKPKGSSADPTTAANELLIAQRNLANTYVWSAAGGFFAETNASLDSVSDEVSGTYEFTWSETGGIDVGVAAMGASFSLALELGGGGGYTNTRSRTSKSSRGFELQVESTLPSNLYKYSSDANGLGVVYDGAQPVKAVGKVDAYRFMTFYLDASSDNYEDFFNKVVDPIWLNQSDDPNAIALRKSQQPILKPPCWRVMHRVTFVSRVLPKIPGPTAPPIVRAMQLENLSSNYELIQRLDPYVRNSTFTLDQLANATRDALRRYLPRLVPHADDIIRYLALYYAVSEAL